MKIKCKRMTNLNSNEYNILDCHWVEIVEIEFGCDEKNPVFEPSNMKYNLTKSTFSLSKKIW